MQLGEMIVAVEKIQAKDNGAVYGHSGIVTDSSGTTLEALWTVRGNDLLAYTGQKVIIGRWHGMTPDAFEKGIESISDEIHETYPWWRLAMMALGLGKVETGKYGVCSEIVCKFLIGAGFKDIGCWTGQNPDNVAEIIENWRDVDIVFEGIL